MSSGPAFSIISRMSAPRAGSGIGRRTLSARLVRRSAPSNSMSFAVRKSKTRRKPKGSSSAEIAFVSAALFSWLIWPIEYTQPSAAGASSPPKMMSRPSLTLTAT